MLNIFARCRTNAHALLLQASFKSDLLVVLQQEPSRMVRKKVADLVAELARSLIDDDGNNM